MNIKIVGQIMSVSLLMNLAAPLYAATPTQPTLPSVQQPTTPVPVLTKQEIAQQIATIKKTIKGLKTINAVATTLVVGGAITAVYIALSVTIGGICVAIALPGTILAQSAAATGVMLTSAGTIAASQTASIGGATLLTEVATAMTATAIANAGIAATIGSSATAQATLVSSVIIGGTIATLVAGSLGKLGLSVLGGLDAVTVLTALVDAKKLETLEKEHPGSLTKDQMLVITQFNKVIKGPIASGIAKGLQLKKIKNTLSTQVLTQNPSLIATLGGEKKAHKFIENYFDDAKQLGSLKFAYELYKVGKKALQKERNTYKKLSSQHIKLDLKIAGLDLKFAFIPLQISILEKKLAKIHQKYPGFLTMLLSTVKTFITESEKVIAELAKPAK